MRLEKEVSRCPGSECPAGRSSGGRWWMELVRSGRTPQDLAREFEPNAQWVRQADREAGASKASGTNSAERDELSRLRRKNHRLRQERDILAKAAAWFAKDKTPSGSLNSWARTRPNSPSASSPAFCGSRLPATTLGGAGRLQRTPGLCGVSRRRLPITTRREPAHGPTSDLVGRVFTAPAPNLTCPCVGIHGL